MCNKAYLDAEKNCSNVLPPLIEQTTLSRIGYGPAIKLPSDCPDTEP